MLPQYFVLIAAVIAVIVVAKMLAWPFKKIMKLAANAIIGAIMIILVNMFGATIGINIDFNILTALIAGIFGIPGVVFLIILGFFI